MTRPELAVGSTTRITTRQRGRPERQCRLAQAPRHEHEHDLELRTTIGSISSASATAPFQAVKSPPMCEVTSEM